MLIRNALKGRLRLAGSIWLAIAAPHRQPLLRFNCPPGFALEPLAMVLLWLLYLAQPPTRGRCHQAFKLILAKVAAHCTSVF